MSTNDSKNDPMSLARKMWGSMGFSSLPDMMTPTFDADEIDKKVKDLKAVESWLKMNLSMLQMTIQGLEMQSLTLNAVRAELEDLRLLKYCGSALQRYLEK